MIAAKVVASCDARLEMLMDSDCDGRRGLLS